MKLTSRPEPPKTKMSVCLTGNYPYIFMQYPDGSSLNLEDQNLDRLKLAGKMISYTLLKTGVWTENEVPKELLL